MVMVMVRVMVRVRIRVEYIKIYKANVYDSCTELVRE